MRAMLIIPKVKVKEVRLNQRLKVDTGNTVTSTVMREDGRHRGERGRDLNTAFFLQRGMY